MHLSPPPGGLGCCPFKGGGYVVVDFLFVVTPIVGVCNCSMLCCTLLYVHSIFAIILMGKRELAALLNLSSWCLIGWLGGSSSRCRGVVCSLWLWYFLIILTIFATSEMSTFKLAYVAEQAGLNLTLSETPKTGFLATRPTLLSPALISWWPHE